MSRNAQAKLIPFPRREAGRRAPHELEFLPAAIEIIETPASPAGRLTMRLVIALAVIALAWACFGKVDIIATATGRIIPSGKVKTIQPLEIGIVKAIHVSDGDRVQAGAVLIELDPTTNAAEEEKVARDLVQAEIDAARLTTLLAGKAEEFVPPPSADAALVDAARRQLAAELAQHRAKIDGFGQQIAAKAADRDKIGATIAKIDGSLPFIEQKAQLYEKLAANQYTSKIARLEAEQALTDARNNRVVSVHEFESAQASILALGQARDEAEADFRRQALDDLAQAKQKAAELHQEQIKAAQRTGLQVLRAPVDGTVEQLAVHTIGGVVTPAQSLLTIVPDGFKLEVEAMLPNRDVGFVQKGQEAEVKVEAFTYTRYGLLRGHVESVSRDSVRNEREPADTRNHNQSPSTPSDADASLSEQAYIARIALAETSIETEQGRRSLEPGMTVTAEIKTGQRRIVEYLLSPLLRYQHEALRER